MPLPNWCRSVRDREKEIETGDGQMNRTRKGGGGLWNLFRENDKTFLNVTFGMILDSVEQMLAGMEHSDRLVPFDDGQVHVVTSGVGSIVMKICRRINEAGTNALCLVFPE